MKKKKASAFVIINFVVRKEILEKTVHSSAGVKLCVLSEAPFISPQYLSNLYAVFIRFSSPLTRCRCG